MWRDNVCSWRVDIYLYVYLFTLINIHVISIPTNDLCSSECNKFLLCLSLHISTAYCAISRRQEMLIGYISEAKGAYWLYLGFRGAYWLHLEGKRCLLATSRRQEMLIGYISVARLFSRFQHNFGHISVTRAIFSTSFLSYLACKR